MKNILLAATALAMLGGAAFAQSTSNSGSNSSATNLSGSQSSSVSNPNVIGNQIGNVASSSVSGANSTASTRSSSQANVSSTGSSNATTNVYLPTSGDGTGSATGTQNLNYGGSYTVRNTPEVIAPNVAGGNPCAVGASGGIGLPGFGLTAGTTWADKACELRQKVALLYNMGEPALAREMMCQDDDKLRAAMQRLGKPCGVDLRTAALRGPAPAIAPAAASVPAAPVAVAAIPATPKPEWCKRASPSTEASKDYFLKVCT